MSTPLSLQEKDKDQNSRLSSKTKKGRRGWNIMVFVSSVFRTPMWSTIALHQLNKPQNFCCWHLTCHNRLRQAQSEHTTCGRNIHFSPYIPIPPLNLTSSSFYSFSSLYFTNSSLSALENIFF